MTILAFILVGLGTLIATLNFYLSFARYPSHRLFSKEQSYKFASGIPLIGSILLWLGALIFVSAGAMKYAIVALIVSLFDTGGAHWFFLSFAYHWLVEWRANGET